MEEAGMDVEKVVDAVKEREATDSEFNPPDLISAWRSPRRGHVLPARQACDATRALILATL